MNCLIVLILVTCFTNQVLCKRNLFQSFDSDFWTASGENDLKTATSTFDNLNQQKAKNVVMMIGDGMDLTTTVAGRIKIGQDLKKLGEEHITSLDKMPHLGLMKTYSLDNQVPDSAATATAILTGVKTRQGMLGVDSRAVDCETTKKYQTISILHRAIEQGKSVGIVTNTRIQHATPAASYSHALSRKWYSDRQMTSKHKGCKDISQQLFDLRHKIQVVLGGGLAHMVPKTSKMAGGRLDSQNFIEMWKNDMKKMNGSFVSSRTQLLDVDFNQTDYLFGVFAAYELGFILTRSKSRQLKEPTLAEMTSAAVKILKKNPKGFFLLVEGGLIDKGHHRGVAAFALEEFKDFEKSVQLVKDSTSTNDTLLIVTADHGHTMTLGGDIKRGNPILGVAKKRAKDGKSHSALLYGNGPGYTRERVEPPTYSKVLGITEALKHYRQNAAVPLNIETHSGEDMVAYASGPHAHLIHGVHEQNYLAHVMFYASCLGPKHLNHQHCNKTQIQEL